MPTRRKAIPKAIANEIKRKNRWICCVCRTRRLKHIHHIDKDPSNNLEENLAALCQECHDEAHTKHEISRNLSPEDIISLKEEWERAAARQLSEWMLPETHFGSAIWTYINLERLPHIAHSLGIRVADNEYTQRAFSNGLMTDLLLPGPATKSESEQQNSHRFATFWDRYQFGEYQLLHYAYNEVVCNTVLADSPIDLESIWSKSEMVDFLSPGGLVYCNRGFSFKALTKDGKLCPARSFQARAGGIRVCGVANTEYFYGSSALYTDYSGTKRVAMLGILKSVRRREQSLDVEITPLAFGVGFRRRIPSSRFSKFSPAPPEELSDDFM